METEEAIEEKKTKPMASPSETEKSITRAMRDRVGHFKDQADSLTLEGVRRLLEKDLGMETFSLDIHKRFIKQCLQECFETGGDDNTSKTSREAVKEVASSTKEKRSDLAGAAEPPKEAKENISKDDDKTEGSPVLGLLEEEEDEDGAAEDGTDGTNESQTEKAPSEDMIKKAIKKRASYFRTNSHKVTMVDARRLLEDDLKLAKSTLDPFKTFIREQVDQILESTGDEKLVNEVKKKKSGRKASESDNEEQSSQSLNSEDEEEEVKPKKKVVPKRKIKSSEQPTKRKRSSVETKTSSKKQRKTVEQEEEKSSDSKDGGNLSEDGQSQSSVEEPVKKKKEVSNFAYGKRVEHLKSVIKSCGMSVPPSIYKRVKQAPESKRETCLIKELEDILKSEGLSANPSEKDIKTVKKRKERTKELEGIDLSNIVSTSRRRSSFSSMIPPKPQTPVESDEEESEEHESNDEEGGDDDDAGDTDGSNSEGASEESNEDAEDEDSD